MACYVFDDCKYADYRKGYIYYCLKKYSEIDAYEICPTCLDFVDAAAEYMPRLKIY